MTAFLMMSKLHVRNMSVKCQEKIMMRCDLCEQWDYVKYVNNVNYLTEMCILHIISNIPICEPWEYIM